ncbi:MAG: hypothetical protein L6Q57_02140 [Alphaproteobacteria bacterium]|nr:hypothetical protein [Alphaproteobacteria bacterium]
MYQNSFDRLQGEDRNRVLTQVTPALDGMAFDTQTARVMALPLPFYPGLRLLEISATQTTAPARRFVIEGKSLVVPLNYTNEPIYALNDSYPISLTKRNVEDYARFFLAFVRGPQGRFLLVDNVDDIPWKEEPPPQARKAIAKLIRPLTLLKQNNKGHFALEACLVFINGLFQCQIDISPSGHVRIYDETLLLEDMPVLDDTFGQ